MAHLKQTLFGMFTLAALAAGIALMPTPAEAGFQFSPAPKAGAPATAAGTALPDNGPLMPMVAPDKVETDPLNRMPVPPLPAPPADPLATGDLAPQQHVIAAPVDARASAAPGVKSTSTLPDAVGFGSDLPLVLGMHQIIPPQYSYAFDQGVDQGAKISWNGGKPWDTALNNALQPLGYTARVEGTTVHVSSGTPATALATPPAPPAPPVMAAHASGDMPRAPLSPAADIPAVAPAATLAVAPVAAGTKPVREVYVHRNATGTDVEERAPGKPETPAAAKKDVVLTADDNSEEKSFWERANPVNWGQNSSNTAPAYNVDRSSNSTDTSVFSHNDNTVETPVAAPAPNNAGPVARMSDNDARVAAGNAGATAPQEAHVPSAPDDVADAAPESASAPVILTHGPGEVSREAIPAAPLADATAPASAPVDVLNNSTVMKWEAKKGDSLKTVLQDWSAKAKVQLYWVPAQDYTLPKPVSLTGSYTDAVADILGVYGDKGSRPVGRLHPNLPNGPSVLIIEPAAT